MTDAGIGNEVRALVFDVFGTVVDWRSSVIKAGEKLSRETGQTVDWTSFAEEWRRKGYHEQIAKIRKGEAPYETTDVFMRHKLEEMVPKYGLKLTDDQKKSTSLAAGGFQVYRFRGLEAAHSFIHVTEVSGPALPAGVTVSVIRTK